VCCRNGLLLASSFHTALFSLVTALVIYSAKPLVRFLICFADILSSKVLGSIQRVLDISLAL